MPSRAEGLSVGLMWTEVVISYGGDSESDVCTSSHPPSLVAKAAPPSKRPFFDAQVVDMPAISCGRKRVDRHHPCSSQDEESSGEFSISRGWKLRLLLSLEEEGRTRARLLVTEVVKGVLAAIIDTIPSKVHRRAVATATNQSEIPSYKRHEENDLLIPTQGLHRPNVTMLECRRHFCVSANLELFLSPFRLLGNSPSQCQPRTKDTTGLPPGDVVERWHESSSA